MVCPDFPSASFPADHERGSQNGRRGFVACQDKIELTKTLCHDAIITERQQVLLNQLEPGRHNDAVIGIKIRFDPLSTDRMPWTTAKKNGIRCVKAAQSLRHPMSRLTIPGLQNLLENVFGSLFQRMNLLT